MFLNPVIVLLLSVCESQIRDYLSNIFDIIAGGDGDTPVPLKKIPTLSRFALKGRFEGVEKYEEIMRFFEQNITIRKI